MTADLAADCDRYLSERTATYEQRAERYRAALHVMEMHGGLTDDDILLDLGAGGTDLDAYLRRSHLWRGRYWPVDGWQGVDLSKYWAPARQVDWLVMLEFIEHIPITAAYPLMQRAKSWVNKGIVLSTPNALAVDVLAMDDTHLWGATPPLIKAQGYECLVTSLYGSENDSLLGWWIP